MKTITTSEAIQMLPELLELSEGVRLGQLFAMIGFLGEDEFGMSLWDIEDEDLLSALKKLRRDLLNRVDVPAPARVA